MTNKNAIQNQTDFDRVFYSIVFAEVGSDVITRKILQHGYHWYKLGLEHQKQEVQAIFKRLIEG